MAFLVHLFFSPHSNQHARNHQRECFLGGRSCRVLRCHRVRISSHLLCSIADLGPCCADSLELWPSRHAFTSGCTHLISRCTKSWCVILSFNAPNTTSSVGRCGLVSSDICAQAVWHAQSFSKLQDTGYRPYLFYMRFYLELSHCKLRERGVACSGRCSIVSFKHIQCPSPTI